MNTADTNLPGPISRWKESWLVFLLCGVAGLRVFIYGSAFPFFNNVDEAAHFDMVVKYSQLRPPTGVENYSPDSAPWIAVFSSPEYMLTPDQFAGGKFPSPPWLPPSESVLRQIAGSPSFLASKPDDESTEMGRAISRAKSFLAARPNYESADSPLYYVLAGLWMDLGLWCGCGDIHLLYWIRFLNIPLAAALVWLGYAVAQIVFPECRFSRLGVPLLLAFFPQDIYYSIQSDVLSPLCFGAAFLGLVRWLQTDTLSRRLGALTGLALAAVWLVKVSNLPLVAVAVLAVVIKSLGLARAGKLSAALPAPGLLLLCAALPIGAWCLWSQHAFGDITGASPKIHSLGWTRKPFLDWWHHPIFTPSGLGTFLSDLLASFWRGEFVWGRRRLALPAVDTFYWISSLLLPGVALVTLFWKRSGITAWQRQAFWLSLCCFAAAIAFLGLNSIAFDFGTCFYPSPAYPYLTSGRLLCGALIPFLVLYVHGLDSALRPVKSGAARMLALGGIVLLIAISELVVSLPAFSSEFNWFHL